MRLRIFLSVAALLIAAAGCQSEPPTVVYIVLSPTPETTIEPSPSLPATQNNVTPAVTIESAAPTDTAAAPTPIERTPLPPNFPTPVVARIQVVEQLFEGGRMFWLEPNRQIWVMRVTGEGRGEWTTYSDEWVEGVDPDSDPSLTPPEGLIQPIRGFGKVWREVPGLREALGWAVTPEFGYLSDYQYVAGGSVDAAGNYTSGPGYHVVYSLYGEQFRFNEADSTWQLGGG